MKIKVNEFLHIGMPRRSGRYPWGSGEEAQQSGKSLGGTVKELRKKGLSDTEIAKGLGMTRNDLHAELAISGGNSRSENIARAIRMKNDKQMSTSAIAREMGRNESTIREWLKKSEDDKMVKTNSIADMLRKQLEEQDYIDIGSGVELYLGISKNRLRTATKLLEQEGYVRHNVKVEQLATGKYTNVICLGKPDTTWSTATKAGKEGRIGLPVKVFTEDKGRSFLNVKRPVPFDADRVYVKYTEDGGSLKDGVIELRRGVRDLDLGKAQYAQVRVNVNDSHYLKGMAMYGDDIPDGYDIVFNTNKTKKTAKMDVFKPLKKIKDPDTGEDTKEVDWDNPFGATIKNEEDLIRCQTSYKDKNGRTKQSPLNIVNEEGDWNEWSKTISSQMLAKQNLPLIKKQLKTYYDGKQEEYDEIDSLTNPTIKKYLMNKFADGCDAASVHLKAAGFDRQAYHVILPIPKMKETEIYAPKYQDGEKVALIRFPHGGIFEIPELTVNNKQRDAKRTMNNATDAVGINPKVAEQLSGADFDGDTVIVIPTKNINIKTRKPLDGLVDYDPKISYAIDFDTKPPKYQGTDAEWNALSKENKAKALGIKLMTKKGTQKQMGLVTNLVTDMQIKGADWDEVERAVRHSMTVIDAEKHKLNYQQSALDNRIADLKVKYQGGANKGSSTLLSRASSEVRISYRKDRGVDPLTGDKLYEISPKMRSRYNKKSGEWEQVEQLSKSTKLAETKDARTLIGDTNSLVEIEYAAHSNRLKDLARTSRLTSERTVKDSKDPVAAKKYEAEVQSLKDKLQVALANAPLERQAQLIAGAEVRSRMMDNPAMDDGEKKRIKNQALAGARVRTGASKTRIVITDNEWEAIQNKAIGPSTLESILNNTDLDKVKALATPRTVNAMNSSTQSRATAMLSNGNSLNDVAQALGVSVNAISNLSIGGK